MTETEAETITAEMTEADETVEKTESKPENYVEAFEKSVARLEEYVEGITDEQTQNEVHQPIHAEVQALLKSDWPAEARDFFSKYTTYFKGSVSLYKGASATEKVSDALHERIQRIADHLQALEKRGLELTALATDGGAPEHQAALAAQAKAMVESRPVLEALSDIEDLVHRASTGIMDYIVARRENKTGSRWYTLMYIGFFVAAMGVVMAAIYLKESPARMG